MATKKATKVKVPKTTTKSKPQKGKPIKVNFKAGKDL